MKYPIIDTREIDVTECEGARTGCNLLMTYGLPRSGKSTWAREQAFPIVCPDAIRFAKTGVRWWGPIEHEVWATARTMVRALFLAGHDFVILDSTCGTRKQRDMFLSSPDVVWQRYSVELATPAEECIRRAESTYPDLMPVIKWMVENWEPIVGDENIKVWQPSSGRSRWRPALQEDISRNSEKTP